MKGVRGKGQRGLLLAGILLLSVVLRLGVAFYLGGEVDAPALLTDQRSYHTLGARLVAGYGFSFDEGWYPFTPPNTPTAHWSFLYSLFVAGVYALFGPHPLAVRVVQAVAGGLLLPWMVYRLARTCFRRPGAANGEAGSEALPLVAALVAALYAYFLLYAAALMTETFYITAVLWSLERAVCLAGLLRDRAPARRVWPVALVMGLGLGIGTLLRQSLLPWVPVLGAYLLWIGWRARRARFALAALASVGLILAAFILPWTVRNYIVYDDFLLLNSNAGYALYSAQHPMHGTHFNEFAAARLPDGWWGRPEPQLDRDLLRLGLKFIADDPGRYALLSLDRARAFLEFWPSADTTPLHNVGRTASFGVCLPFMLYGLVLAVRRPRAGQTGLLLLFAGFYTLVHVLTWAMVRYRLPVDAALMPLVALAVLDLVGRARRVLVPQAA